MKMSKPKRFLPTVRKALRLPPSEIAATAHSAVWFALAEVAVRTRPLAWSARRFGVRLHQDSDATNALLPQLSGRGQRAVRAVRRLSPRIYGSERGCLRRSLVLGHHLRAHEPVMRIGVRRDDEGAFSAHAWIELDGTAIDNPTDHVAFDIRDDQL